MHNKFLVSVFACFFTLSAFGLEQSEVEVSDLPAFTQNTVGISTVFDEHIFDGSQPQDIIRILDALTNTSPTPAVMNIITSLLMQDTTAGSLTFKDASTQDFLTARLKTLFELGQWDHVLTLIDEVPQNALSDDLWRFKIDSLFLKGDTKQACALLENKEISDYSDKMRISCFLADEEKEKAVLSYDIYKENANSRDELFDTLSDIALNELPLKLPQKFSLQTPHIFLFSLTKEDLKDVMSQKVFVRKALLDLPATDIALRLRLARFVILSQDQLERIYKLPLLNEDADKDPSLKRAELLRSFLQAQDETQKGLILMTLLENVRQDKQTLFTYPLLAKMLSHITPDDKWRDLAFDAVQIYALMGDNQMAINWYDVLKNAPQKTYQKQKLFLVPLMNHLGEKEPDDTSDLIKKFCSNTQDCQHFWYMYPYQTFKKPLEMDTQNIEEEFQKPVVENKKQPSFSFMTNPETQKGEKILKALLELVRQQDLKKREELLEFLKQLIPLELFRQLEREEMVY